MYSKQLIIKKLQHAQENGDTERIEKFKKMLAEKKPHKQRPGLREVIKYPNLQVLFIRGKKEIYCFTNGDVHVFKLKMDTGPRPSVATLDEKMKSQQVKNLGHLGFTTNNARTFHYDRCGYSTWISMMESRIKKIKVNGFLVNHTLLRVFPQENRLVIRKGLTFDDIKLLKNKETLTNSQYQDLMETIK